MSTVKAIQNTTKSARHCSKEPLMDPTAKAAKKALRPRPADWSCIPLPDKNLHSVASKSFLTGITKELDWQSIDATNPLIPDPTKLNAYSCHSTICNFLYCASQSYQWHGHNRDYHDVLTGNDGYWTELLIILRPIAFTSDQERSQWSKTPDINCYATFSELFAESWWEEDGICCRTGRAALFCTKARNWVGTPKTKQAHASGDKWGSILDGPDFHCWGAWLQRGYDGKYQLVIFDPNTNGDFSPVRPAKVQKRHLHIHGQKALIDYITVTRQTSLHRIWLTGRAHGGDNTQGKCLEYTASWLLILAEELQKPKKFDQAYIAKMDARHIQVVTSRAGQSNISGRDRNALDSGYESPTTRSGSQSRATSPALTGLSRSRNLFPTTSGLQTGSRSTSLSRSHSRFRIAAAASGSTAVAIADRTGSRNPILAASSRVQKIARKKSSLSASPTAEFQLEQELENRLESIAQAEGTRASMEGIEIEIARNEASERNSQGNTVAHMSPAGDSIDSEIPDTQGNPPEKIAGHIAAG